MDLPKEQEKSTDNRSPNPAATNSFRTVLRTKWPAPEPAASLAWGQGGSDDRKNGRVSEQAKPGLSLPAEERDSSTRSPDRSPALRRPAFEGGEERRRTRDGCGWPPEKDPLRRSGGVPGGEWAGPMGRRGCWALCFSGLGPIPRNASEVMITYTASRVHRLAASLTRARAARRSVTTVTWPFSRFV